MIDFPRINTAALGCLESLLCEWLPGGKRNGGEFVAGDLTGKPGSSLGINLKTGRWQDFAGSAKGGDPIDLLAAIRGCSMAEAAREIDQRLRVGGVTAQAGRFKPGPAKPVESDWEPLPFAPAGENPEHTLRLYYSKMGIPSAMWFYRVATGEIAGCICRFNKPDGSKEVMPFTWCRHKEQGKRWRWKSMLTPRPLYRLTLLTRDTVRPVLIVEGEKTADAAARLLPDVLVTTWAGGCKAIEKTNWAPLAGRKVSVWPDADEAGLTAASALAARLPGLRLIKPPDGVAQGWDLADAEKEGWTTEMVVKWARKK